MRHLGLTVVKFGVFAVVMAVLTGGLFLIFGQYQTGSKTAYSAIFTDVSSLREGDSVRMAGIRIGTVDKVSLRDDKKVEVGFDADRDVVLTSGTRAVVRYLNLVGDRYLELVDSPGSTGTLAAGSQIPVERTAGALDLDLLLGGLKPVIQGLNPDDVNALTSSLIAVFQDQGDTVQSLMSKTASFTNTLADNSATVQAVIDNLKTTLTTLSEDSDKFSGAIDRLQRLADGLSKDRDPIGEAIECAQPRDRLARRPTHAGTATTSGHRRATEPPGAAARPRQGTVGNRATNGARELQQTHSDRGLRQLRQLLPVRRRLPGQRFARPYRGISHAQARSGKVRGALMLKYRGPHIIRAGFIGLVLVTLVIAVGLQPGRLWSLATQITYRAFFAEAGGLAAGNHVKMSGVDVGTVTDVTLQGLQPLVTFKVDGTVRLASDTSAHIRTGSLLGERILVLESAGNGTLRPLDVIPASRTSSPYSLTDAVGDLTQNAAATNTDTLNQSLDTLAATIDQIAPQLGPTFDGLTRLSKS